MTACMTYHLTKTLRTWGQKMLSHKLNDTGRKLLSLDGNERPVGSAEIPEGLPDDVPNEEGNGSMSSIEIPAI